MDKHCLRNGMEVFHLNRAETDFLYDEVFVSGSYLSHGISLASNDVVFDVGANIGIASLFFHERCGPLRIHAFEPDPNVFAVLEANDARDIIARYPKSLAQCPGFVERTRL